MWDRLHKVRSGVCSHVTGRDGLNSTEMEFRAHAWAGLGQGNGTRLHTLIVKTKKKTCWVEGVSLFSFQLEPLPSPVRSRKIV